MAAILGIFHYMEPLQIPLREWSVDVSQFDRFKQRIHARAVFIDFGSALSSATLRLFDNFAALNLP